MTTGESTAVDFARSSVTWLLPEQPSYGRFSIDAALTIAGVETFYLCAQVFAGHVYGEGPLFQDPPYGFAAAFSRTHYRIFRDPVRGASREDSSGEHRERFKSLHFEIVRENQTAVEPRDAAVARIRTQEVELEFPVRHANWRDDGRFQIETGPVLFLEEGPGDPLQRLRRAYVILGDRQRAEFLVDAERPSRPEGRWRRRVKIDCQGEFFRSSTPACQTA